MSLSVASSKRARSNGRLGASASVHGWLWFLAAFADGALGTRLRPLFGLRV